MEKSFYSDFEEWELLPDSHHTIIHFGFGSDIDINYFSDDKNSAENIKPKEEGAIVHRKTGNELGVEFKDIGVFPKSIMFKKLKDDEFVDMKIEFPRTFTNGIIMPPGELETILFDSEDEDRLFYRDEMNLEKEVECVKPEIRQKQSFCRGFELKIWRWRVVGGVRSLCSLGVAAVTICVFVFGQHQIRKNRHQNKKIQFQIYTHNKQAPRRNKAFFYSQGCSIDEDF